MALVVKIGADMTGYSKTMNDFKRDMRNSTKDLTAVGKSFQKVGAVLTAGLTVPLVGLGIASVKTGITFEKSMSEVAAISGATGKDFKKLEDKAREMGANTSKSAIDAADGMKYMALAGWNVGQQLAGIEPILKASVASNADLGLISDLTTDTLSALGLKVDDLGRYLDNVAETSRSANTDMVQLMESYLKVGGSLKNLNVPLEESSSLLGIMANRGIKGSEAGTKLSAIITNLTNPTGRAADALDALNLSAFDSKGNFKGLESVLREVRDKTLNLTEEQRNQYLGMIAGKNHIDGLNALVSGLGEEYDDLKVSVINSNGALEDMYNTMTDNTAGSLDTMKSAFEEMRISIFDHFKKALDKVIGVITKLINWFNNLSPAGKNVVIVIGIILAAIGPLLMIIGTAIIMFAQVTAAVGVLGTSFLAIASPILIAIAAIAALVAIFWFFGDDIKAFYNKYFKPIIDQIIDTLVSTLKPIFIQVFDILKVVVKDAWEMIKQAWEGILKPIFDKFIDVLVNTLKPIFEQVFDTLKTVVKNSWEIIKQAWEGILKPIFDKIIDVLVNTLKPIFEQVFGALITAVKDGWGMIKMIWEGVLKPVFDKLIDVLVNILKPIFIQVFDILKSAVKDGWEMIKKIWEGVLKPVFNQVIDTLVNTLKPIFIQVFDILKVVVKDAWEMIKKVWEGVLKPIFTVIVYVLRNYLFPAWQLIFGLIVDLVFLVFTKIRDLWIKMLKPIFEDIVYVVQNFILPIWRFVFGLIADLVSTAFTTIKDLWTKTLKPIFGGIIDFISNVFKGNWKGVWEAVVQIFKGIWEGIKTIAKAPLNGLISLVNSVIKGINKIQLPSWLGGKGINIPEIPKLATGGTITGSGHAIVGEAGPELISKSGAGVKVTPLSAGEKARGISGALGEESSSNYYYSGMFANANINWYGKEDIMKTMQEIQWVTQTRGAVLE